MNNKPETDTEKRVFRIASRIFKVSEEQLSRESSPDTVPTWDSLRHMGFVLALEQEFNIRFDGDQIGEMLSLTSVLQSLEEQGIK